MFKVVPDTNVLISGMIGHSDGFPRHILNLGIERKILLVGNHESFLEFSEKIKMPRLRKYLEARLYAPEKMIMDYKALINISEPFEVLKGKRIVDGDPDDDLYFRIAKASSSKIIVSGDKEVLKANKKEGITVVSPKRFIEGYLRLKGGTA